MTTHSLQPPGAGLPWYQHLVLRYIAMPLLRATTTWEQAEKKFHAETARIEMLVAPFSAAQRAVKILIPPQIGLEDSSRYWSVDDTLEHLIIVTTSITAILLHLAAERNPDTIVSTADVKPRGQFGAETGALFTRTMAEQNVRRATITARHSTATHRHPWFGPMDLHAWHTCWVSIMVSTANRSPALPKV